MLDKKTRILFLNQMAGPLFRELAEELSKHWQPCTLYTGHPDTLKHECTEQLKIVAGPGYNKKNEVTRVVSWFIYFTSAFFKALTTPSALLFFVSNPPFLGLIGFILKKIRKQPYVVLVYDIHPDILVNLGRLKGSGVVSRLWHWMNRLVYENAEVVFTIGDYMAANLEKKFDVSKTKAGKVVVVPPWVDTEFIKPIPKSENWFAKKYNQVEKITILYSGNLGATHNIEFIIDMARELKENDDIHFLIIGEGAKWKMVEEAIENEKMSNVTLLPFQTEEVLPYSMATGDIAVVSMVPGTEGLMVPSKAYYYLAAGCSLLFKGNPLSEVGDLCKSDGLGVVCKDAESQLKVEEFFPLEGGEYNTARTKAKMNLFANQYLSRCSNSHILIRGLKDYV